MHVITCSKGAILIHNESQLMQEPSSKNRDMKAAHDMANN